MGQTRVEITHDGGVIRASGLVRRFGDFVAVDGVDLQVDRGEVFGLLGANGAGKTTVIRMLCGTLPPTAGEIRVGEVDMVRRPRYARGRIGYVAQRFALYGDLTVLENLRLQAGLYGVTGRRQEARLAWALEQLDLADLRGSFARDLPLGYQRRLALAAALLHEPEALFLDEPTSGVDPLARQHFWELIYTLAEEGMGILVTTHYMDEALFCDRLALMHAGRVVEEGTPEALLQRPLPTPILTLRSAQAVAFTNRLARWPEVREMVPHAGQLRIRLHPGSDPEQMVATIYAEAARAGLELSGVKQAEPELEDVFVAMLEQQEEGG